MVISQGQVEGNIYIFYLKYEVSVGQRITALHTGMTLAVVFKRDENKSCNNSLAGARIVTWHWDEEIQRTVWFNILFRKDEWDKPRNAWLVRCYFRPAWAAQGRASLGVLGHSELLSLGLALFWWAPNLYNNLRVNADAAWTRGLWSAEQLSFGTG